MAYNSKQPNIKGLGGLKRITVHNTLTYSASTVYTKISVGHKLTEI